ncbi:MAG: serpin family protein [Verrucomicrobia bacterium]|nr:MAG: serpin family protein [Verrucomicrobiota bacterium]
MKRLLILHIVGALTAAMAQGATNFDLAAKATNELTVELHRQLATGDDNLCISPYSIESALAMTYAGADGETRTEMARVLHLTNDLGVPASFSALQHSLEEMSAKTTELAKQSKKIGGPSEPITLHIANRLFAQKGYQFRDAYLSLVKQNFGGAFEPVDFIADPAAATQHINKWVADQTRERIRDLIPLRALDKTTRLVLANALYLKAPWANEFSQNATQPEPFFIHGGGAPVDVPMMRKTDKHFGYARHERFTVVSLAYAGNDLQFLVLLPDEINGLRALESKLTADMLASCAKLEKRDVDLYLPKFKLEPPTITLAEKFKALGMNSAFDKPQGSANFDRMAPRKPNDYLYISQIFHKTFIAVDEKGTEAAAATAVAMMAGSALRSPPPPPIEVKVDRPFVYAIQHTPSGVCLFLGRVTDPR